MAAPEKYETPEQLRAFLDAVPDMLILARFDSTLTEARIVAVNKTVCVASGLTEEELIGMAPRELMSNNAIAPSVETRRALAEAARKNGVIEYPVELRLAVPNPGPRMRIRMIWPDPADTLVLIQAEILTG